MAFIKTKDCALDSIHIRMAETGDIPAMIQLRADFLRDGNAPLTIKERDDLQDMLKPYLEQHLGADFFALLAFDGGQAVASLFLASNQRNAIPPFVSERFAVMTNLFTYGGYRGRGIASNMVSAAVDLCKRHHISAIELTAGDALIPFYTRFGFAQLPAHGHSMRLALQP